MALIQINPKQFISAENNSIHDELEELEATASDAASDFIEPILPQSDEAVCRTIDQYEKRIYDLHQMLELSRSLCSTLEYDTLIGSILYTCMGQVHVLGAGLFVLDDIDSNAFTLGTNHTGLDLIPDINYSIPTNHPLITILNEPKRVFTMQEIREILEPSADLTVLESINPSIIVPLIHKTHVNGILVMGKKIDIEEGTAFSQYDLSHLLMISTLAAVAINNASLLEKASTDMMTHLKLKHFFYSLLTDKLDAAISNKDSLAVIMIDIDYFKKFNDTWGHECGDMVLKAVAKSIKENIRPQDTAARYGGEEFTLMLPSTSKEDAMAAAEHIRCAIEKSNFDYNGQKVHVTISAGISVYDSTDNPVTVPKELVNQADKALYASKKNGRNRITFADKELLNTTETTK